MMITLKAGARCGWMTQKIRWVFPRRNLGTGAKTAESGMGTYRAGQVEKQTGQAHNLQNQEGRSDATPLRKKNKKNPWCPWCPLCLP